VEQLVGARARASVRHFLYLELFLAVGVERPIRDVSTPDINVTPAYRAGGHSPSCYRARSVPPAEGQATRREPPRATIPFPPRRICYAGCLGGS